MTMIWVSDWNTGIDVIDEQHKRIVDYINALENASMDMTGKVLQELVDYTESHFAFEESLQVEAGYEYAVPHKATHETFIKRLNKYQERHETGEAVAEQLYAMLATWLIHHIKRDDMAYVTAVQENLQRIVSNKKEGGWLKRSLNAFFG
jgi:hemerythrin